MAMKTDALQQTSTPKAADSLLLADSDLGTARLTLAQAAAFFGAELVKAGNPVGAALSGKAALSAQETVEKTNASPRTVELAASELPGFINALPRLLNENLTVKVSGTLNEYLNIHDFYGGGSIWIEGAGGCTFQKGISVNGCSNRVTLKNLEFSGHPEINNVIVSIQISRYVSMQFCTILGTRSADSEGEFGVRAELCSLVNVTNCGVRNCKTAMLTSGSSIVTVYSDNEDGFSGSGTGAYAYHGGIVLLAGRTPDLLGGNTNSKSGGLIVKRDGTLL